MCHVLCVLFFFNALILFLLFVHVILKWFLPDYDVPLSLFLLFSFRQQSALSGNVFCFCINTTASPTDQQLYVSCTLKHIYNGLLWQTYVCLNINVLRWLYWRLSCTLKVVFLFSCLSYLHFFLWMHGLCFKGDSNQRCSY